MAASAEKRVEFKASRYNLRIPHRLGMLLYNTLHGSVMNFRSKPGSASVWSFTKPGRALGEGELPEALVAELLRNGFITKPGTDEVSVIKERFDRARDETPIALTITTTMDCNLGCYYCYEERSGEQLSVTDDVEPIVLLAKRALARAGKRTLHVDWYGGEPMLNLPFIEAASSALQRACAELGVKYRASIVSNGTRWPSDVGLFIERHHIKQVQLTFDGLKANHDKRRFYRKLHRQQADVSSFDAIVRLVDQLLDHVRLDLRFNIDPGNANDFAGLVRFARERGWFSQAFPLEIQPARLQRYSERSNFMREQELDEPAFERVRREIAAEMPTGRIVREPQAPDGFPYPRMHVCAALATDSVVVGADRQLYRCGLQVGEAHRSVGAIHGRRKLPVMAATADDADFWRSFDPTEMPRCRVCTFLPVCWSGCPKTHLERDSVAIREQSDYWRRNLAGLVARGVGIELEDAVVFSEQEQFPDGEPETYLRQS